MSHADVSGLRYPQWIPTALGGYLEGSSLSYSTCCPWHFQSHFTVLLLQRPDEMGGCSVLQSCGFRFGQSRRKGVLRRNPWCNSLGIMLSFGVPVWKGLHNHFIQAVTPKCVRPTAQAQRGYLWVCVASTARQALLHPRATTGAPSQEPLEGLKQLCHGNGSPEAP